jgi:hypothetical protein
MKLRCVLLFGLTLALSTGLMQCSGAEKQTNDTDVIAFGIPRSTLIVSGEFLATFSGGFGANSHVKVDKVFKAHQGFGSPAEITVYWTTLKEHDSISLQQNTNAFLFFLRPEAGRGAGEYRDATGETYPFVRASQENVRLLTSKLEEKR